MDASRFDRFTTRFHQVTGSVSRRRVLRGLALGAAATRAPAVGGVAGAKKKLCAQDGSGCRNAGSDCKAKFCLTERFTVQAIWTNDESDHDTHLFVPKAPGSTDPSPFINFECNPDTSDCETSYPFACVNQDAQGPGNEVTTVSKVLKGKYEYWIDLDSEIPAKDLEIKLRRRDGSLVRSWKSPANQQLVNRVGWHVFTVNGRSGRVKSIDRKIAAFLPGGAHDPNTDVCPFI